MKVCFELYFAGRGFTESKDLNLRKVIYLTIFIFFKVYIAHIVFCNLVSMFNKRLHSLLSLSKKCCPEFSFQFKQNFIKFRHYYYFPVLLLFSFLYCELFTNSFYYVDFLSQVFCVFHPPVFFIGLVLTAFYICL